MVGGLRRGKPHEVPSGDLELFPIDLGHAAAAEDVDSLLLPLVRVVDERLLAGRHPHPADPEPREPG